MKNLYKTLTTFTVIAGMIFSFNLAAYPPERGGPHGERHQGGEHRMMTVKRILMHLAALNLTDEQIASVKQIVKSGKQQSKPLKQQLKQQHKQLRQLARVNPFDEQAIRDTSAQIAAIQADLMILHLNKKQQVKAVLTDDQRAKLEKMKEQRHAMKERI